MAKKAQATIVGRIQKQWDNLVAHEIVPKKKKFDPKKEKAAIKAFGAMMEGVDVDEDVSDEEDVVAAWNSALELYGELFPDEPEEGEAGDEEEPAETTSPKGGKGKSGGGRRGRQPAFDDSAKIKVLKKENPRREGTAQHTVLEGILDSKTVGEAFQSLPKEMKDKYGPTIVTLAIKRAVDEGLIEVA